MITVVSIISLIAIVLLLILQYREVHSFVKITGRVIKEDYGKFVEYKVNEIKIKRELLPAILHINYNNNDTIIIYVNKYNANNTITIQQAYSMYPTVGFKLFDLLVTKE